MPKASDLSPTGQTMMLLKGPFKFGKTIAACSSAIDGPIYLAYWDKKEPIELLTFFKKHRPELLSNITYDVYGSENANEFLNKLQSFTKNCPYKTIINDSVTNMTSSAVNWSLGFRNPKGPKKDPLNERNLAVIPDFDEYKVETGIITQSLDISRKLPANIIWTCHPVPSLKIEGGGSTGNRTTVSKVNNIVTYGSKAGAIIPGNFTEIYHFNLVNEWDGSTGTTRTKRVVSTRGVGDEFAGTALNLPDEFDITDKLFWEVWKDLVKKGNE